VLSPPEDLAQDLLTGALTRQWGVAVTSAAYRPVGFGSHHWSVTDPAGGGWFVTVDDLETKRHSAAESLDDAYGRLGGDLWVRPAWRAARPTASGLGVIRARVDGAAPP